MAQVPAVRFIGQMRKSERSGFVWEGGAETAVRGPGCRPRAARSGYERRACRVKPGRNGLWPGPPFGGAGRQKTGASRGGRSVPDAALAPRAVWARLFNRGGPWGPDGAPKVVPRVW